MITIDDLKKLAAVSGPCLTIFAPVRDPFSQVTKTDTRIIAAVQKADELLIEKGFNQLDRENFLRPITKLATNTDWSGRTGSIIVFRAPGFTQAAFWPDFLDARVTLGEEFFVLPLLGNLASERNFWVLALSINKIHLWRGTCKAIAEYELPKSLPRSLADFLAFDNPDHDLEGRSAGGPSSGTSGSVRFGTSSASEGESAHLHDYFKAIERTIHPILTRNGNGPVASGTDPLILAAVPRELALYRLVNTYAPLVDQAIHGSPDALGLERLHKSALDLLAAHNTNGAEKYNREIDSAASRKLLLTDPAEIAPLARSGQVARLLVNGADNDVVINAVALAVLQNSGSVTCSDSVVAPGGVAAILRFRVPALPETEPETAPAAAVY